MAELAEHWWPLRGTLVAIWGNIGGHLGEHRWLNYRNIGG